MTEDKMPMKRTENVIPTMLIRGAVVMLLVIGAAVTWARVTDRPLEAQAPRGPIEQERTLHLSGTIEGSARVTDENGRVIAEFEPGDAVFISTIARVINRERAKHGADLEAPVQLRLREGNRLALFDPQTGRETELVSFGADNVAAFRRLLEIPAL
ncbi:MAG: photosynthetic complex assembly protein PuhC [Pseudomonadota bacterium]